MTKLADGFFIETAIERSIVPCGSWLSVRRSDTPIVHRLEI
jgi:hypothetical protein